MKTCIFLFIIQNACRRQWTKYLIILALVEYKSNFVFFFAIRENLVSEPLPVSQSDNCAELELHFLVYNGDKAGGCSNWSGRMEYSWDASDMLKLVDFEKRVLFQLAFGLVLFVLYNSHLTYLFYF